MIDVSFPADLGAAKAARDAVDGLRARVPSRVLDDIRLLVSELVTNSVRHAGVDPTVPITLRAEIRLDCVHVEVVDGGPGFDPVSPNPAPYQTSGWGLFLVGRIADRWGVSRDGTTTVWFELTSDPG